MFQRGGRSRQARTERGASLFLIAASLVVLLAMAGLAIDLGALYVARSEAQRAADAAALAGAQEIVDSTFPTGGVSQAVAETLAAQQAATVGNQNPVAGANPSLNPSSYASCGPGYSVPLGDDICFDFSTAANPKVSVLVRRTAGSAAGPVPTFFMKIFGILSKDVSAEATAEAYAASGALCLKPWLLPNCDPWHTTGVAKGKGGGPDSLKGNPNCPIMTGNKITGYADYLVWELAPNKGQAVNPGPWTGTVNGGGVVGEPFSLTPDTPQSAPAPSKYYEAWLQPGNNPTICPPASPNCVAGTGGGGTSSGALYRQNIECCNTNWKLCGSKVDITAIDGRKVGPTQQGTNCLINAPNQDTISFDRSSGCTNSTSQAYQICAGGGITGIPKGTPLTTSPSVATVPIFDLIPPQKQLCPGSSCNTEVPIYAYAQMFITNVTGNDTVNAYLMIIGGNCGGAGPSSGGTAPIQVRLIHPPTS